MTPPTPFRELGEALDSLAREVRALGFGNAANRDGIGAIEGLTMHLDDRCEEIVAALRDIADAIRERGQ